jgi:hypothetical protein
MGYANGPWQEVANERLGGPVLKAQHDPKVPRVAVQCEIPMSVADDAHLFEAFDAQGRRIPIAFFSGPSRRSGRVTDTHVLITLDVKSIDQVDRIRFQTRPWRWVTFHDVPLHPKVASAK